MSHVCVDSQSTHMSHVNQEPHNHLNGFLGDFFWFVFWLLLCNYITFCCERTFSVARPCIISNVFLVISSCLEKQNLTSAVVMFN